MSQLSRRKVLLCSSTCAMAAGCLPREVRAYGDPIPVGKPEDFAVDEISEKFIRHNFFVIRREKRLYTITASCPHAENYLFRHPENAKQIACAGHDAFFDLEGRPLSGPVKKGLVRYKVTRDEEGIVLVDPFVEFPEKKWEAEGSFLELG